MDTGKVRLLRPGIRLVSVAGYTAGLLLLWGGFALLMRACTTWRMPGPYDVWLAWVAAPAYWGAATLTTFRLACAGIVLGIAIGLLFSMLLYLFPRLDRLLQPLLMLTQNLPMPVLAPLLVIPLGFGFATRLLAVLIVTFFPVVIAVSRSMRTVEPTLQTWMDIMGASRRQKLLQLALPHSIPACLAGSQITCAYGMGSAIWAESLGTEERGLGSILRGSFYTFRMEHVFSVVFLMLLLSLLVAALLRLFMYFCLGRLAQQMQYAERERSP